VSVLDCILEPDEVNFRCGRLVKAQQLWLQKHEARKLQEMRKFLTQLGDLQARCEHTRIRIAGEDVICADCGTRVGDAPEVSDEEA